MFFHFLDTYLQARVKARKAENESDLNSDCEKSLRKVRQKKNISSDESSSDENGMTLTLGNKCSQKKKIASPPKIPLMSMCDSEEVESHTTQPQFDTQKSVGMNFLIDL